MTWLRPSRPTIYHYRNDCYPENGVPVPSHRVTNYAVSFSSHFFVPITFALMHLCYTFGSQWLDKLRSHLPCRLLIGRVIFIICWPLMINWQAEGYDGKIRKYTCQTGTQTVPAQAGNCLQFSILSLIAKAFGFRLSVCVAVSLSICQFKALAGKKTWLFPHIIASLCKLDCVSRAGENGNERN